MRRVTALLAVLLAGACSHTHWPYRAGTTSANESHAPDSRFSYDRRPIAADNHVVSERGRYQVRRVSFASSGRNGQPGDLVTVDYHRSVRPGSWPAVRRGYCTAI